MTQWHASKAYDAIIGSSKQSNKAVNTAVVGTEDGIEAAKKQRQATPEDAREWADALANSNPNKMTPELMEADLEEFKGRRAQVRAMFDMLDVELGTHACDHTRWLTQGWLEARGHDVDAVFAWLDTQGGYCDCEVLANVEQNVEEAKNACRTPPN